MRLCNEASVFRLLCNSLATYSKTKPLFPRHPSRLTQTLLLHGLSPHAPTTTLRERRERERSALIHLRRTAHALRWRGRLCANRFVGLLLLLWVLFSVSGFEGIFFGEAADDTGSGRLVVFSGNIDSEFLLRVRNIV